MLPDAHATAVEHSSYEHWNSSKPLPPSTHRPLTPSLQSESTEHWLKLPASNAPPSPGMLGGLVVEHALTVGTWLSGTAGVQVDASAAESFVGGRASLGGLEAS